MNGLAMVLSSDLLLLGLFYCFAKVFGEKTHAFGREIDGVFVIRTGFGIGPNQGVVANHLTNFESIAAVVPLILDMDMWRCMVIVS